MFTDPVDPAPASQTPASQTPASQTQASQTWDPAAYNRHAGFVADLGVAALDLLDPQPGERILDLGCGEGALTRRLVERGAEVVGVDQSADMVRAAVAIGLDARVVDGADLPFHGAFDAVFSNAALHWMTRPDPVIAGVHRALRPRGRFVGEFGGHGNVAAIRVAVAAVLRQAGGDPSTVMRWYFPTPQEYTERLEAHGFSVDTISLIPRPTPLPTDVDGWLATFAGSAFDALDPSDRTSARAAVRALLAPVLCDEAGRWTADYVRLRFAAKKG